MQALQTPATRDDIVLSLLQIVNPLLHLYAKRYDFDYEELRQDACIHILEVLAYGDRIQNLEGYVWMRVRSRIINKMVYRQRRRDTNFTLTSLEAPLFGDQDITNLADMIPSPYYVEPLSVLLAKERIEELRPLISQVTNYPGSSRKRHMLNEMYDTTQASL